MTIRQAVISHSLDTSIQGIEFAPEVDDVLAGIGPSESGKTTLGKISSVIRMRQRPGNFSDGSPISNWREADFGRISVLLRQYDEPSGGAIRENTAWLATRIGRRGRAHSCPRGLCA